MPVDSRPRFSRRAERRRSSRRGNVSAEADRHLGRASSSTPHRTHHNDNGHSTCGARPVREEAPEVPKGHAERPSRSSTARPSAPAHRAPTQRSPQTRQPSCGHVTGYPQPLCIARIGPITHVLEQIVRGLSWVEAPDAMLDERMRSSAEAFDDRGVGHTATLTHRLQVEPAAAALEFVE